MDALIRFRLVKDLSAEQLVTGRVHRILIRAFTFGYIEVACLRATAGLDGKLLHPCSFRCCCHFICQQCNSEVTQPGDGRSSWYISASLLTLLSHSSGDNVIKTDGIMDRPNKAVCWWQLKSDCISAYDRPKGWIVSGSSTQMKCWRKHCFDELDNYIYAE